MDDADIIDTSLLRGQVRLLQPRVGFHAAVDTVLLAAAALPYATGRILDVGCGVGSVGLCITLKNKDIILNSIDIQSDYIELARRNAALNDVAARCTFVAGDIMQDTEIPDNTFDLAVTNPPFQAMGRHLVSPVSSKALANGELSCDIDLTKWCKYLHKKLKQGGRMVMIHRADRLDEILQALTARRWFGSLTVLPIHPRAGADAKRVIITARKERYSPLVMKPGWVMHMPDGSYTPETARVLDGIDFINLNQ